MAEAELFQLVEVMERNAQSLGVRPEAVRQLRAKLHEGLAAIQDQARAFNSARDRLLAHVSHELRTPLTPALLAVCLLQREKSLTPAVQEGLAVIQRHIEQEARLIDTLIDQAACSHSCAQDAPPRLRIA